MARRSGLAGLSVQDLQRELRTRQRRVGPLMKRRAKALAKLAKIDAEIAGLGGSASGGGVSGMGLRKRPKNEMNLVDAMAKLLNGKTMGVTEIAEAVQKAGYQTTSPSFRTIVNQTLINNKNVFKRVERGQYTAK
jgi:hypothetical protein